MLRTLLLGLSLLGPPASSGVEFRWDAPTGCPTEEDVRTRLEATLGEQVDEAARGRTTAIARVRQDEDGWSLRLWVIAPDSTREREVRAETCDLLADAAVLLAAMVLDPEALERAPEETAEVARSAEDVSGERSEPVPAEVPPVVVEVLEPEHVPEAKPEPVPEPEPEPRRSKVTGAARIASGVDWGVVPGVGPALVVGGAVIIRRVRIDVEAQHTFARGLEIDPDATAHFSLTSGIVRVGPRFQPVPRLWLRPAGGVELGAVIGRAEGLERPLTSGVTFAAVRVSGELSGTVVPWMDIGISADGHVALLTPHFSVEGTGEVWRVPRGGIRGLVFIDFHPPWMDLGRAGHSRVGR